ncbi:MAG: RNA methyltransferase [Bacteroidota bacterium]
MQQALLDYLGQYVSEGKKDIIDKILAQRTRYLTVVLEDIYHSQNASAVIRSCDCFGIQDLHVIENKHVHKINPRVVHGASKWVDVISYSDDIDNSSNCFRGLRNKGYKLIGTVPEPSAMSIYDLKINNPIALVFGTEKEGLSASAREYCEEFVTVPMYGFTDSFNISVSAALCMNIIAQKLFSSNLEWALSVAEKQALKLSWYRKIVHRSDLLEKEFLKSENYLK